jgi:hypothetical protein
MIVFLMGVIALLLFAILILIDVRSTVQRLETAQSRAVQPISPSIPGVQKRDLATWKGMPQPSLSPINAVKPPAPPAPPSPKKFKKG